MQNSFPSIRQLQKMVFKWPSKVQALPGYISVDSEEKDSLEGANLLSQESLPKHSKFALDRHRLFLHIIYGVSAILVISSLILTFTFNFTIVRRSPPELELPYGNPIENGNSHWL